MDVNEIVFKPDTAERKRFFTAGSFSHPAKMHLQLQIYLVEHYTKPGETVLDPMGGSGTLLFATTLGRNVILVELENKFVKMQQANWRKIKRLGPMLGYTLGGAAIIHGDARNLSGILADKIVFSPPYAEALDGAGISKHNHKTCNCKFCKKNRGICGKVYQPMEAGQSEGQISNLPYGSIDSVITSPSYEKNPGTPSLGSVNKDDWGKQGGDIVKRRGLEKGYNQNNQDNIGNLKSTDYLSAMSQVYLECHKVLKDGGLMIIVVKNFIRDKKIIRLDLDTIKIVEAAGFKLKERLARKLTQQSF